MNHAISASEAQVLPSRRKIAFAVFTIVGLAAVASILQTAWAVFRGGFLQAGLYWILLQQISTDLLQASARHLPFLVYIGAPIAVIAATYRPPFPQLKPALVALFLWGALWPVLGYGGNETNFGVLEIGLSVGFVFFLVLLNPIVSLLKSIWGRVAPATDAFLKIVASLGRPSVAISGIAIFALGIVVGPASERLRPASSPPKPNIIFFVVDALRADHLGVYGYSRTTSPFLDGWARSGLLFERAYSAESYTMASIASLFTSFYPNVHQVLYDLPEIDTLSDRYITLAEILKNAGYETAAFVFNPHLNKAYNFAQGFDYYDDNTPYLPRPPEMSLAEYWETAEKIRDRSLRWLRETHDATKPFFLYLHYRDVHQPYLPPPPYDKAFSEIGYDETRAPAENDPDGEDRQYFMDQYDGEIRYTDDKIRELVEELTTLGLLSNTIVLVTADHGETFFEEHPDAMPLYFHGGHLYEEDIHVPLMIVDSRRDLGPKRIATPVSLIDVLPTVLALLDVDYRGEVQGSSLLPLMLGLENYRHTPVFSGGRLGRGAIIDGVWKYYARIDYSESQQPVIPRETLRPEGIPPLCTDDQLFSLTDDPLETKDLADEQRDIVAELRSNLQDWYEGGKDFRFDVHTERIDSETLEQLRSLGYVQ